MSADKVQEAHDALVSEILDEMSGGPPGRPTRWGRMIDDLIAAVREDEKARCVAAVKALPGRVIPTHADLFEVTEAIRNA